MTGIPVHTSSPINPNVAANPGGVTPQTTEPESAPYPTSTNTTAVATATHDEAPYPPARPGVAPGPAPTGAVNPTPTRTIPTASTTSTQLSPPPPQPGATPAAPNISESGRQKPSVPPPPKAGEVVPLPSHQQHGNLSDPNQTTRAQPPASVTSATIPVGTPVSDLSHPPGYRQNSQASFDDRPADVYSPFQNQSGSGPAVAGSGDGILGTTSGSAGDEGGKGFWGTAGDWARKAGEKMSEGHDEIWRRINNEK